MSRSMQATGSGPVSSDTTLSHTARASARTHSARAATSPKAVNSSSRASATRAGEGLSRVSAGKGVAIGSPNASANRPARVVAARTDTC